MYMYKGVPFAVYPPTFVELEVVDTYATFYTQKCSFDRSNASEDQLFASLTFDVTDLDNGGDIVTVIIRVSPTLGSSTVYVDNVTIQEGIGVGKFSYVNYGSFEQSLSNYSPSEFWSMTDSSTLAYETVTSEFDQSLKITGDLTSAKSAKQRITFSHLNAATQPTFLRLSGFAKAESSMYNEESKFRLRAIINYSDGTSSRDVADFNKSVTDWQFVNIGIPVESGKTISSVDIFCDYDYNFGNAYFDDIKLVAVDDHTVSGYTYDEITGLPDAYITGMGSTFYKYYDKNNSYDADVLDGLLKLTVTSGTNKLVYYNYNPTTRNITSEAIYTLTTPLDIQATAEDVQNEVYNHIPFDEIGMITDEGYFSYYGGVTYTYNTYGLVTQTISTRVGYSYPSVSTVSYNLAANSKIFGSLSEQTDSSGYVTKYFYDSSNGQLLAAVSGKSGESTYDYGYAYTYDAMGRTTQVVPATCTATATSATANNLSAKQYTAITRKAACHLFKQLQQLTTLHTMFSETQIQ